MIARDKHIFTFGYSGASVFELKRLSEQFDATVVDVRYSRKRKVEFAVKRLTAALKEYYVHIPQFGNENYKNGGPIKLADPELGISWMSSIVRLRSVILLCVCASPERCHRSDVAQLLLTEFGLPVRHLTRDDVVWVSNMGDTEMWIKASDNRGMGSCRCLERRFK